MINYFYKIFINNYLQSIYSYKDNSFEAIDGAAKRIHKHQSKMPDYLGLALKLVASLFIANWIIIKIFFSKRTNTEYINIKRRSKFSIFRKLIRFHDSLFQVSRIIDKKSQIYQKNNVLFNQNKFDYIIIGSGPGGAISAYKLQQAGFETCIIESGNTYPNRSVSPYSYEEMLSQYKYGGISTTLGNANITYIEGLTFGGGSEVNSGLYHRTPSDILKYWQNEFDVKELESDKLEKYFLEIEDDLCISHFPDGHVPLASLKLHEGAKKLDWKVHEAPRWFRYNDNQSSNGQKMTMTQTYLKKFLYDGGKCYSLTKAKMIKKEKDIWNIAVSSSIGEKHLFAKNVILSAGTISTPLILKKSGLSRLAGNRFQMHPTIKVVALFNEKINRDDMGVPVHQVKEFSPKISFGCSISSKSYLRVAMLDHYEYLDIVDKKWEYMAIYYAMIIPEGTGSIDILPFFKDPLVRYNLTKKDNDNLAFGLKKLCELLMTAGAIELYQSIWESPILSSKDDINKLPNTIDPSKASLMSVHLFSSCPIGERKDTCVANSYGKVFGQKGLFISDGSILPSAPGVNPQGSIMALAHRNIENIIAET